VTISFQRSTKADLQIQTISDFRREKKSPFIHTQTKLGWKRGEKSQLTIAVQCPDKPRQRTAQQQPNPIQTVETLFQEKIIAGEKGRVWYNILIPENPQIAHAKL
jgi:hypothetical protein